MSSVCRTPVCSMVAVDKYVRALREHREMYVFCATIGDFSYFRNHLAVLNAAKPVEEPYDRNDKMFAALKNTAETVNNENGEIGRQSAAYFENNKQDFKTADEWKDQLEKRRIGDREKAAAAVDVAYAKAEKEIAALPSDAAKEMGTNLFLKGMDVVIGGWDTILKAFQKLFSEISDFLKKIWGGIQKAAETVVGAVKAAGSWIGKLFGG